MFLAAAAIALARGVAGVAATTSTAATTGLPSTSTELLYIGIGVGTAVLGLVILLVICIFYVPCVKKWLRRKVQKSDSRPAFQLPPPPAQSALKRQSAIATKPQTADGGGGAATTAGQSTTVGSMNVGPPGRKNVSASGPAGSGGSATSGDSSSKPTAPGATVGRTDAAQPASGASPSQQPQQMHAYIPVAAMAGAPSPAIHTLPEMAAPGAHPTPAAAAASAPADRRMSAMSTAWGPMSAPTTPTSPAAGASAITHQPGPPPKKSVSFTEQLQIPQLPPGVYSLGRTSNQVLESTIAPPPGGQGPPMPMPPGFPGAPSAAAQGRRVSASNSLMGGYGGIPLALPPLTPQQIQQLPPSQQAMALSSFYPLLYQPYSGF